MHHVCQATSLWKSPTRHSATVTIDIHFVLDIHPGWNHASLPIAPDASTIDTPFADAPIIGRVLQFEAGQYKIADSAQSEIGYWFYAARAAQLSVPGTLADNIIDFPAGWSTFGPATEVSSPLAA